LLGFFSNIVLQEGQQKWYVLPPKLEEGEFFSFTSILQTGSIATQYNSFAVR